MICKIWMSKYYLIAYFLQNTRQHFPKTKVSHLTNLFLIQTSKGGFRNTRINIEYVLGQFSKNLFFFKLMTNLYSLYKFLLTNKKTLKTFWIFQLLLVNTKRLVEQEKKIIAIF